MQQSSLPALYEYSEKERKCPDYWMLGEQVKTANASGDQRVEDPQS